MLTFIPFSPVYGWSRLECCHCANRLAMILQIIFAALALLDSFFSTLLFLYWPKPFARNDDRNSIENRSGQAKEKEKNHHRQRKIFAFEWFFWCLLLLRATGCFSLLSCDYEVNCAEERDVAMFHALSSIYVARFAPSLFRFAFSPLSEPVETGNHLSTGPFLYLIVLLRSLLRRGISNDFLLLIERKLRWKLFNSHNLIVIVLTYAREIFSKPKSFLFVYGRVGGIFFLASTTEK